MQKKNKKILVTGGAGFIGSAMIRYLVKKTNHQIVNLDKLTYASNLSSLNGIKNSPKYKFVKGDINNKKLIKKLLENFKPNIIINFAAETHVDRSINDPKNFIKSNVVGTSVLLECAKDFWFKKKNNHSFLFHHVSTDEVFGSLNKTGFFKEDTPYNPNSPYSATKASSDHLVRAWHKTYGLPVIISNCSNNYGPYQFPEKLIPLVILNALENKPLPVYGNGQNIRDWLYVEDHIRLLYKIAMRGKSGETYNIGGKNEKTNLEVVKTICEKMDKIFFSSVTKSKSLDKYISGFVKNRKISSHKDLITFVEDRPGHDIRYAIDNSKIEKEFNFTPTETFETGIEKTIKWYLKNLDWCKNILNKNYTRKRLGIIKN